ncbi:glycosyltransferase family 2 protein [Lysinibacillus pakistanensis]|uniref:glycosyltransferase family 2 protein n=1 Tax=Lysinibacillus pakistanensis TaxID=759811 RepID=UPI003D27D7F3
MKKQVVFGVGPNFERNKEYLPDIDYFVDNDNTKHRSFYMDKEIRSFEDLLLETADIHLIITLSNPLVIENQLNLLSMRKNIEISSLSKYLSTKDVSEPKVSILIPTYNRESIIEETIKSALDQNYSNFEIIVNDNNSEDKTYEVLCNLQRENSIINIDKNKENVGAFKNWYECIKKASGEYCKILFSDDLISKDYLKLTTPYLRNNDVGFVTSKVIIGEKPFVGEESYCLFPLEGTFSKRDYYMKVLFEKYQRTSLVSPGAALFRTKDVKEVMEYILENNQWEKYLEKGAGVDLLIYLCISTKYSKIAFVNKNLCFFRAHPESITIADKNRELNEHYLDIKKFFVKNKNITEYLLSE